MRSWGILLLFTGFLSFAQQNNNVVKSEAMPVKVYESEGVKITSYDFNSLEPILHKKDNTTYVINFWATWCLPCVKELPHFEQLNEKYKNQNVKVILVSMDMPKKVESALIPFVLKKKLQSEILHLDDPDANAWIEKVDATWSGAIPATVIYNANKRMFYERSFTYVELENELLKIINK